MPSPTTASPNATESTASPARVPLAVRAFGSGLFSGYSPVASGTVGSAVGLAFYFIPGFEHPYIIMPASFLVFLLGIKASEIMEAHYGHDPAEVTIDEVLGMWMSLFLLPKNLAVAGLGFILFRLFDIFKPFPARKFDQIKGGAGIMLDDVIAAVYTNIVIHIVLLLPFARNLLSLPVQ